MKNPMPINEWMTELLEKIDKDDSTTLQICAFMSGLMHCPWSEIKEIELSWLSFGKNVEEALIKPEIRIHFK